MPEFVDNKSDISNGKYEKSCGKQCKSGLLDGASNPVVIWNQKVPNTQLEKFQRIIEKKYKKCFASYWEFHKWSIEHYTKFWEEVWHFCKVICSREYEKVLVKTGPGFLDNDWFVGARFNYAENILRNRDDMTALIYIDELGEEETVTFAEMFEEVKLYAAAFRKYGLKKGDTVACYMSHRKEAIFAMLATTSIGAIWGGPSPWHGGKYASNIVQMMDAKFLITMDFHIDDNVPEKMLEYIPIITDNCPSIKKVILLVTQNETYTKDLSNIKNCLFLENFLKDGRNSDGSVPDIIFEQLPFSHPICMNFTSGTTGSPKAPVHSAGTLITEMRDFSIHMNMKRGDVACSSFPVGWSIWNYFTLSLGLGITNFLYCSSVFLTHNGKNFWDMMAEYNVKLTFLATHYVDKFQKMDMQPSPTTNLDCLKIVGICGTPVKTEHCEYLINKVKKDLFIGNSYGSTEVFGTYSGFNFNMPAYAGEIQAPSLGIDMKCFDEKGNSVIGQRGELVVCTPAPNFPVCLWKDENNARMKEAYLSKYPALSHDKVSHCTFMEKIEHTLRKATEKIIIFLDKQGVWCQNDQCWINPKTNGFIVIGRSDDEIKQNDIRFSSGDIYLAIQPVEELEDYICVAQQNDNGDSRAVLFVKMRKGHKLTPEIRSKMGEFIDRVLMEDCIPECIVDVPDIPYNINNKRMESVVRKIVATNKIPKVMSIRNPESLKHFLDIPEVVSYNQI